MLFIHALCVFALFSVVVEAVIDSLLGFMIGHLVKNMRRRVTTTSADNMNTLSNRRGSPDLEGNFSSSLPISSGDSDQNKKNRAPLGALSARMKLSRILRYSLAPAIFLFGSMTYLVPNFKGYNPVSIHCL
jgi:hypothetical protein